MICRTKKHNETQVEQKKTQVEQKKHTDDKTQRVEE